MGGRTIVDLSLRPPASLGSGLSCHVGRVHGKTTGRGQWAGDGVCGRRRRRSDHFPAWQPDILLPVAQRHSPCRRFGPLHRSRPDRNGRLGVAPRKWARQLPLRGASCLSRRLAGGGRRHRQCHAGGPRLGIGVELRLAQSPPRCRQGHRLHGRHHPDPVLGCLAGSVPGALSGHAVRSRGRDRAGQECIRGAHIARFRDQRSLR